MKIATIVGARPQIIKAAALSRTIQSFFAHQIEEVIIHTGQHYDENMSEIFFAELHIPAPNYNLNCRTETESSQIKMITKIQNVLKKESPDAVIVFGDTTSTLAGSLAATALQIPLVHIEAGLRSFNPAMPEELNRYKSDHLATLLFAPTDTAIRNLQNEGIANDSGNSKKQFVFRCGDIMYDNTLFFWSLAQEKMSIFDNYCIDKQNFILATVHRNFNTDNINRLEEILTALIDISNEIQVVLPLHPRTQKAMENNLSSEFKNRIANSQNLRIINPLSFLEMTCLESFARLIITDSGGVQKEAFFFKKNAVILRPETEWTEIVDCGAARLSDANRDQIMADTHYYLNSVANTFPNLFGDGYTAKFICQKLIDFFA